MKTRTRFAAALLAAALLAPSCGKSPPPPPPDAPGLAAAEEALGKGLPGEARRGLRGIDLRLLATRDQRMRAARAALKAREPALGAKVLVPDASGDAAREEEPRLLRAECLLRAGALDDASKELGALEAADRRGDRWKTLQVLLLTAKGETTVALKDAQALVEGGCREPDALVVHAALRHEGEGSGVQHLRKALAASSDRIPIVRALGKALLNEGRQPGAASAFLEEAVRARPWDRDARLDLARARIAVGGERPLSLAAEDMRRLVADDPEDRDARVALADALGAAGLEAARATGNPAAGEAAFREAEAAYQEVLRRGVPDAETGVAVLQALARTLVERIPLDHPKEAAAPGSYYARAVEALSKAETLDPEGRFRGAWGIARKAETCYLRARAARLTHSGSKDHAEALGWYEQAIAADGRHLEALWDLVMIHYDFLRTAKHIQRAFNLAEEHVKERERRGLPPLSAQNQRILMHIRKLHEDGKGFEPGTLTPEAPTNGR